MINCLLVGAGGFLGAVCRYLFGLIPLREGAGFPIKTLLINLIGAFAIGLIAALAAKKQLDPRLVLMLRVGVCGGFTTFSTFAFETQGLMQQGHGLIAVIYALASVVLCVLAVFAAQAMLH